MVKKPTIQTNKPTSPNHTYEELKAASLRREKDVDGLFKKTAYEIKDNTRLVRHLHELQHEHPLGDCRACAYCDQDNGYCACIFITDMPPKKDCTKNICKSFVEKAEIKRFFVGS